MGLFEVFRVIGVVCVFCVIVVFSLLVVNYCVVWLLMKNFSNIYTYVRVEGVEGGLIFEKAGVKVVVLEVFELFF